MNSRQRRTARRRFMFSLQRLAKAAHQVGPSLDRLVASFERFSLSLGNLKIPNKNEGPALG